MLKKLFADQNENTGHEPYPTGDISNTKPEESDEPDQNEINREQEHADVFCEVHGRSIRTDTGYDNPKPSYGGFQPKFPELQRLQIFDQIGFVPVAEAGAVIVAGIQVAARSGIQNVGAFIGITERSLVVSM